VPCLAALRALLSATSLAAAGWVLVASFPQGRLYRRADDGPSGVALRADGRMDAPAWAVRDVLLEPARHPGVAPYLVARRVVAAERCMDGAAGPPGCKVSWVYERFSPPVASDRDQVLRVEIRRDGLADGTEFELAWELDDGRGSPPPQGVVRTRRNRGAWRVAPDGGATRFSYWLALDPGGDVPAWIVDRGNRTQVPAVIAAVEEAARRLAADRAAASAP